MYPLLLLYLLGVFVVGVLLARIESRFLRNSWAQNPPPPRDPKHILLQVKWLDGFLWMGVIGVASAFLAAPSWTAHRSTASLAVLIAGDLLATIGVLGYYICLGILARNLGASWKRWVIITFLTSPVGPFVAYYTVRSLAWHALTLMRGA
jgi:hypothetical protein